MHYSKEIEEELEKIAKEIIKSDKIDEIGRKSREYTEEIIRASLEEIDEKIFRSLKRRVNYESKGKEARSIVTLQGEIRYKRRRYKSYKDGKSYYLLDILIGIMKYKRYSQEVMKRAIINGLELQSFQKAGEKTLEHLEIGISRSTVNRWTRECTFNEKEVKKQETEMIIITADGTYPHIKKGSIKELKVFNFYTIREEIGKNRYRIDSHIYSPRLQTNINRTWELLLEHIARIYDVSKIKRVYLAGDGAKWISKLINDELKAKSDWTVGKEKIFVIDKFHYVKSMRYITKKGKYHLSDIINYFRNGDITPFKKDKKMMELLEKNKFKENFEYIIRVSKNTVGWQDKNYFGCDMEMVMSHYICPRFKGIARKWSKNIFKYSYGLCLLKSNLLEIELEKEEELEYIEDIKFEFKDKEVYFGNFKDKSNVPVLNDWCNRGTRELFNKLIHSY